MQPLGLRANLQFLLLELFIQMRLLYLQNLTCPGYQEGAGECQGQGVQQALGPKV